MVAIHPSIRPQKRLDITLWFPKILIFLLNIWFFENIVSKYQVENGRKLWKSEKTGSILVRDFEGFVKNWTFWMFCSFFVVKYVDFQKIQPLNTRQKIEKNAKFWENDDKISSAFWWFCVRFAKTDVLHDYERNSHSDIL